MTEEQEILAKNLYGPNGVEVMEFLSELEKDFDGTVYDIAHDAKVYNQYYTRATEDVSTICDKLGNRSSLFLRDYMLYLVHKTPK